MGWGGGSFFFVFFNKLAKNPNLKKNIFFLGVGEVGVGGGGGGGMNSFDKESKSEKKREKKCFGWDREFGG